MINQMVRKGHIEGLENFTDPDAPWLVLFHGYGADASDLYSLHEYITVVKPLNWYCPNGVIQVPIGPGWMGRAWWNIRISDLTSDFSSLVPEELPTLRTQIQKMFAQMNVPWSKIIIGGFSQGAMLAVDSYLHAAETPRGLVILSGALICRDEWRGLIEKRKGEKFFISHGMEDGVLPFSNGQRLHQFLTEGGMQGGIIAFSGGHEIPPRVLQSLQTYLNITI